MIVGRLSGVAPELLILFHQGVWWFIFIFIFTTLIGQVTFSLPRFQPPLMRPATHPCARRLGGSERPGRLSCGPLLPSSTMAHTSVLSGIRSFCLSTRNDSRVNDVLLVFWLLHLWAFRHGFAAGIRILEARFFIPLGHWERALWLPGFFIGPSSRDHSSASVFAHTQSWQAGRKVRWGGGRGKHIMALGGASV